jgi:CIC family chloride channel protein
LVLGDEPLFHVAAYHLVAPSELLIYGVLGIVGGLGGVAFVRLLLRLRLVFRRLPRSTIWIQPVVGGLCVGLFGFWVPAVLGVGYDQVDRALSSDLALRVLVLLAVLKIVATSVCYASGNAGGIFGPSMFIGAMIGGAVGHVAHSIFPATTAGPGAYALVGMGTAFAGIIRTPLTSVIMIFEVTRNYTIIVPLMVSNLIAFYISHRLQREPIYAALARQDGLHLPHGALREVAPQLQVRTALQPPPTPLSLDVSVAEALRRMTGSSLQSWPVVDEDGLAGMIRLADVTNAIAEGRSTIPVRALLDADVYHGVSDDALLHVHSDHPLGVALARMGATGHSALPVVSRANARTLLGIVTLHDVLDAYGVAPRDDAADDGGVR